VSVEYRIEQLPPFLSFSDVGQRVLNLRRTATHAIVSRADFPKAYALGARHRVWVTSEVLDWLHRQPRANDRPVPDSLAGVRRYRSGRLADS